LPWLSQELGDSSFWYKFAPNGYILLSDFLQNLASGRESQVRTLVLNFTIVALKCVLTAPKIAKNGNFWYKFTPKGKFRGPQKKLNIGAQLQTFLYAMTPQLF